MNKAIVYVKQNKIEIIYFVLFLLTMCIWFIPFITINLENSAESTYFLKDVLGGNVIEGTSYSFKGASILYIVLISLYFVSIVTWIVSVVLDKKEKIEKRYVYTLNIITISLVLLFVFFFMLAGTIISIFIGIDSDIGSTNILFSVLLFIPALLMCLILFSKITEHNRYTIKEICETSIMVALAVVLDQFAKIQIQANGGSISFSAIPLFLIAIRYGGFKGAIASSLYFGFITCLMDGYGMQTFPFDYLVALSGYGFVGFFFNLANKYVKNRKLKTTQNYLIYGVSIVVGAICAMIIRYIGHIISGLILYPSLSLLENFIYQSTYVPGAVFISMVLTLILLPLIIYINKVFPTDRYKIQDNNVVETLEEIADE